MSISMYQSLPRPARKAAQKLAKKLLQTAPATQQPDEPASLRGALMTAFHETEKIFSLRSLIAMMRANGGPILSFEMETGLSRSDPWNVCHCLPPNMR